jgi:hypothetical protein
MPNRELNSVTRYVTLRTPGAISGTQYGSYVDLQGWDAVDVVLVYGDGGGSTGTITPTILEADTGTLTSSAAYSTVATADLTAAAAVLTDATTAGIQAIGYRGGSRYITIKTVQATSTMASFGAIAVLRKFTRQPSDDATVTTGTVS